LFLVKPACCADTEAEKNSKIKGVNREYLQKLTMGEYFFSAFRFVIITGRIKGKSN
jgi:hypothetical protein